MSRPDLSRQAFPWPPATDASDAALATRTGRGDDRAFEQIFSRYREPLYRYCWSITGTSQDAEEALQTTMINAHRALAGERGGTALRPWLYAIARNACLNLIRDRPAWAPLDPGHPDPGSEPFEVSQSRERIRRLCEDLGALGDRPRTALLLRELAGLSHREIAANLGAGADDATAKRLIHEAREALSDLARGRDLVCEDVRRTVSDGDGRVLRSRRVRSHLRSCAGCAGFRDAIGARSGDLAAIAVLPAAAAGRMLRAALAGSSSGTAGAGLTLGGAPVAGGLVAVGGGVGLKLAAVTTIAVLGAAGAASLPSARSSAPAATEPASARAGEAAPPGPSASPPLTGRPSPPSLAPPVLVPPASVAAVPVVPAGTTGGLAAASPAAPGVSPGAAAPATTPTPAAPVSAAVPAGAPPAASPPGRSGTAPGHGGAPPGRSGTAPGHGGAPPGRSGTAPGHGGAPPGRSGTAPGPPAPPAARATAPAADGGPSSAVSGKGHAGDAPPAAGRPRPSPPSAAIDEPPGVGNGAAQRAQPPGPPAGTPAGSAAGAPER